LVIHFAWKMLSNDIGSGLGERRFRYLWERNYYESHKASRALIRALEDMYRAALTFYRAKRGKGEEAKDVSTFFLLSGLHIDFDRFWHSAKNPYREKVAINLKKFRNALLDVEIE